MPKGCAAQCGPRGGGKRGTGKAEAETKDRAKAWLEGKRGAPWAPLSAGKSEKNIPSRRVPLFDESVP